MGDWPRTSEDFKQYISQESLYEVIEKRSGTTTTVELCYLASSTGTGDTWEFGGVFLLEDCRGMGLADALGTVAIANQYVFDAPKVLIAHVHEENRAPRRLLEKTLGFVCQRRIEAPADKAPATMKRNADGKVLGDEYEFQVKTLASFADWIERFSGTTTGRQPVELEVALPSAASYRTRTVAALRDLAGGS